MAIITLEDYKLLANVKGTDQDSRITGLIEVVEDDYLAIRNKPFEGTEETPIYPTGSKMVAVEMITYKLMELDGKVGTSAESSGKYSHSFDFRRTRGYPTYIVSKIKSYARAR